jgi:hypothetical protein
MLVPNVATIKVTNTAGKMIQKEKCQSSAALSPKEQTATSAIAINTHRKPSRDGVTVTLTAPNDIASIEAIAATTERKSKTARLTKDPTFGRIFAPGMQRMKTAQMAERSALAKPGFSGNVSIRKNATGTQSFADKSVPEIAKARGPAVLSKVRLFPILVAQSGARYLFRKCSCAFQSEASIQPLETPTKPPAMISLRKW